MGNVGEQLKKMLADLKAMWAKLDKKKQRIFMLAAGGLLVFIVGITLILNIGNAGYEVLYTGMENNESAAVYAALQAMDTPIAARMNAKGEVEVPSKDKDRALVEMAIQGIPKSGLPYDIFPGSGSLTSTDLEKRKQIEYQLNNRIQDTLRQFSDIKSADVTISLATGNNKVWETQTSKSTASVTLHLRPGVTFDKDNVSAIRLLVASSVGYTMDPKDVMVIDAATSLNLRGREDSSLGLEGEMERLGYQDEIDSRYSAKVANIISLVIPAENFRVNSSIKIDFDKMITESKEFLTSPDSNNNSGVLEHEIGTGVMNPGNLAGGLPGEEENTDTPPGYYVDNNGDGVPDVVDYSIDKEYAVGYILNQIEKNQAKILQDESTISVFIKGDIDEDVREKLIDSAAGATGLPLANISVQSVGDITTIDPNIPTGGFKLEGTVLYVLIGIVAGLLLLVMLLLILSSKSKKKKLAKAAADAAATNVQVLTSVGSEKELEERKRQIQDAALRSKNENAIADEVREFAKQNPQITANLLRSWLKEDGD